MLRACEEAVDKLGKALWQTGLLCTYYSQGFGYQAYFAGLYTMTSTGFAQFYSAFTQAILGNSYQLEGFLYPVSTRPINNTNLIKE